MSQERDRLSLPVDLLILILKRLRWSSHPSFALACRQWRSAVSPFYPVGITPLLLNTTDVGTTNVRYYSPYFQKNFKIGDTLEAPDAKICYANGRYLTLCITLVAQVIACCMQNNDGVWEDWEYSYPDSTKFTASPGSNLVFHHGLIYILLEDGRLAVCDERRHEEGFEILEKPRSFGFVYEDTYLVESDQGELIVVLIGRRGSPVNVFKLNEHTMEWDKMESLDGGGFKTAIKSMRNKYDWPDIVYAVFVLCDGEFAFVPGSPRVDSKVKVGNDDACSTNMWSCELGQHKNSRDFWNTERMNYSIWVDLRNS
ncbi:hypothetical protein VPH35_083223 [Triticum aestivum]